MTKAKPQDFWDGKTSVYSSKKMARAANKIVRFAESLLPYEREELIRQLKAQLDTQEGKAANDR